MVFFTKILSNFAENTLFPLGLPAQSFRTEYRAHAAIDVVCCDSLTEIYRPDGEPQLFESFSAREAPPTHDPFRFGIIRVHPE